MDGGGGAELGGRVVGAAVDGVVGAEPVDGARETEVVGPAEDDPAEDDPTEDDDPVDDAVEDDAVVDDAVVDGTTPAGTRPSVAGPEVSPGSEVVVTAVVGDSRASGLRGEDPPLTSAPSGP